LKIPGIFFERGRTLSRPALFLLIYLILLVFQAGTEWYLFQNQYNTRFSLLALSQEKLIRFEEEKLRTHVENLAYDLAFLGEMASRHYEEEAGLSGEFLTDLMVQMGRISHRYDQIRILTPDGRETLRLNYRDGKMEVVTDSQLQDKSHRYYMRQMMEHMEGDDRVHIFPMDLNMERGEVERPYNPVLRIGRSFRDASGEVAGYLILNYRGDLLLNNLTDYEDVLEEQFDVAVLNEEGYWLLGPEDVRTWGFMFPDGTDDTMASVYPDLWSRVSSEETGQFRYDGGLITHHTISLQDLAKPVLQQLGYSLSGEEGEYARSFYLIYHMTRDDLVRLRRGVLKGLVIPTVITQIVIILIAGLSTAVLFRSRQYRQQLNHYASVDDMTGCLNRRTGTQILEQLLSLEQRQESVLTVAYVDINNLKRVNDTFGHKEGDRYIRMMVDLIREHLRAGDFLVRMGGDEFLVILPDCRREQASRIRGRIREGEDEINRSGRLAYHAGFSWGLAEVPPGVDMSAEKAVSEADRLMYFEKEQYHRDHPHPGRPGGSGKEQ